MQIANHLFTACILFGSVQWYVRSSTVRQKLKKVFHGRVKA